MKRWLCALVLFSLLIAACGEDDEGPASPCPEEVDLGPYALAAGSADFIPYEPTDEAVIFTDTTGQEYRFDIFERDAGTVFGGAVTRPCPEDSAFQVRYTWQSEFRYLALTSDSLGFGFDLVVSNAFDFADPPAERVSDFLVVRVTGPQAPTEEPIVLSVLVNPGSNPEVVQPATLETSLTVAGKTFQEVYRNETLAATTGFEVFYTEAEGLVGIRRAVDSLWVGLERVE